MENLFKVINLDNKDKIGNLTVEAHSSVKSKKYFPVYIIDGKKMIFKPLSKTKPLTTPLFAYSEVYWSYIINKYFDKNTPRYYLATSKNIEREQPKYYEQGVLVESLTPNNEQLINLFDYFTDHPEPSINIKDYINYCMKNYDYTKILSSNFIQKNKDIGEYLSYQILLSILRQDQNFHYENINFFKEPELSLAPPIDFEFSTPFLYPDKEDDYIRIKEKYINSLNIKYEEDQISKILKQFILEKGSNMNSVLSTNVTLIVKMYPNTVLKFIKTLDKLIEELPKITISDPDNYIGKLNSDYWEVGHAYYKDNNLNKYKELKQKIILQEINKKLTFKRISSDILEFTKYFNLILKIYLLAHYNEIEDLENLTIKELLNKLNVTDDVTIDNINIETKELKLKRNINKNSNLW